MSGKRQDLRVLYEKRKAALARFNEWEKKNPPRMSLKTRIESMDAIRRLMPRETRDTDPDPEKKGVAIMHRRLRCLGRPSGG